MPTSPVFSASSGTDPPRRDRLWRDRLWRDRLWRDRLWRDRLWPGGGVRAVIHHGLVGDDDDGAIGWIREIVLDSGDPWRLASFWAGLLGGTPVQWYPGWVTLEPPPRGQRLSFQGTGAGGTPATGSGAGPVVHFDVLVSDLPAAHERVVASGAAFVGEHVSPRPGPGGELVAWRVYRDPAGHPFCLVTR